MTRDDLDALCTGDSIIGPSDGDEHEVMAVYRAGFQRLAHIRYAGRVVSVWLRAGGPEIRGARI